MNTLERRETGPYLAPLWRCRRNNGGTPVFTVGKVFFTTLQNVMLAIFRSYGKLRALLLVTFVLSLATAAEAMDSHGPDVDAGHGGHAGGVLSDTASNVAKLPETDRKHGSGHETHCSLDALCVTGAWSLMRATSIGLPAIQRMPLVLLPGSEPVKGLRPKPELRPPRADS